MSSKRLWTLLLVILVTGLVLVACGGTASAPPAAESAGDEVAESAPAEEAAPAAEDSASKYQIPAVEEGKYNVAFVYVGPHDDGGWSQAHDVGRMYVEENVDDVHTAYVENVAEGADAEQVIRSLARKGFDTIFTTSFGFMDASEIVADEFPDVDIIHISGFKSNEDNFGNLMGAMENMKYLAGMLAGSRAKVDGNPKLGYIATFPIPEELRLGNAFALGAQETCPECTMDVRWIFTWHDPILEKEAAQSLFDGGAQVVMTGADTPAPAEAAPEGKWGITYDYRGNCTLPACLTSMYWNWGPVYAEIVEGSRDGTWVGGWEYFDARRWRHGPLWLSWKAKTPRPGVEGLPEEDLQLIRDTLAQMLAGEFTASMSSRARSPTTRAMLSWRKVKAWSRSTWTASRSSAASARPACTGGTRISRPSYLNSSKFS